MKNVIDYLSGYRNGKMDGRAEILADIAKIVKENEYPEYIECDLVEYLENKGYKV